MLCMCVAETVCLCVTVCSVWGCCKYSCCTNEIYLSCSLACSLTCLGIDVYTSEWSQYRSQSIYELANGHKYCWETSGHFIFNFFFFFSYSSIVFHCVCIYAEYTLALSFRPHFSVFSTVPFHVSELFSILELQSITNGMHFSTFPCQYRSMRMYRWCFPVYIYFSARLAVPNQVKCMNKWIRLQSPRYCVIIAPSTISALEIEDDSSLSFHFILWYETDDSLEVLPLFAVLIFGFTSCSGFSFSNAFRK